LSNKTTAIVTGSSRGIGKEVAILLSKMGTNVVICSRTQSEIDSAVKEIKKMMIIDDNKHNGTFDDRFNDRLLGLRRDVSISGRLRSGLSYQINYCQIQIH
jgi:NAD(P)-dependent dehydrogenase (short-subunit alcohol dehydrogenase family)